MSFHITLLAAFFHFTLKLDSKWVAEVGVGVGLTFDRMIPFDFGTGEVFL